MNGDDISKAVIVTGWLLAMGTIFALIGSSAYLMVKYPGNQLPSPLDQWTGTALGFVFGSIAGMVRDFIKVSSPKDK